MSEEVEEYITKKKLIIFGTSEAGKTSLANLYESKEFNENEKSSLNSK